MDKLDQLKNLVGESLVETVLKKAAFDAITAGNWDKVLSIAQFAVKEMKQKPYRNLNGLETRQEVRFRSRIPVELEFPGDD